MNDRIRKRTKNLTICAMLCALGVILMTVGAFIEVLDLSTAALASLLCIFVVIEIGGGYPWAVWAATSLLSLLLLPQKTPAIFYALFLGYYPVLKAYFERLPQWISWVLKLVTFHASLGLIYLCLKLFIPIALEELGQSWLLLGTYGLALLCFIVYDFALAKLLTAYLYSFRKYFQKMFK